MDSDLLLEVLLHLRQAPQGTHHAELYALWKAAMCQQLGWTPDNFEERMAKAAAGG